MKVYSKILMAAIGLPTSQTSAAPITDLLFSEPVRVGDFLKSYGRAPSPGHQGKGHNKKRSLRGYPLSQFEHPYLKTLSVML